MEIKVDHCCEVCGGKVFHWVARLDGTTDCLKCVCCHQYCVFPLPRPDASKDDYRSLDLEAWIDYMEGFRRRQYRKDVECIRRYKERGTVLDIGCGPGFFLDEIRRFGFVTRGIEPAKTAADYGIRTLDLDIATTAFEEAHRDLGLYDVVTLFAVLEHMTHPRKILERIREILKPEGLVVVKVPRRDAIVPRLIYCAYRISFGRVSAPLLSLFDWEFQYPHLHHFSTTTIQQLLDRTGFTVLEYRSESSINLDRFDRRLNLTSDHRTDLNWARSGLARLGIGMVVRLADLLNANDDIIVYARRS